MKSVLSLFKSRAKRTAQKGFSLLEIIIVLAIIGMLIGIIVTRIAGSRENANVSLTGTRAANLYSKIIQYQLMNNNQYPADINTLKTGSIPLISPDEANDAWGREFCYTQPSDTQAGDVYIGSKGKDGKALAICYKNGKQQMNTGGNADNSLAGCPPC